VERSGRPRTAGCGVADGVASDGEASSCRFHGGRGGVSRFLSDRRRESVDSGLTSDSATFNADFRRASEPLLNNLGVAPADTPPPAVGQQRCHSSASAPGTVAQWPQGVRGSATASRAAASLMSSRSSIATNISDDADIKYTPQSVGPSVVGDLLIPDEMQEFINSRCASAAAGSAAVSLNADSTVSDFPATNVDSTSGLDESAAKPPECSKPATASLTSCMYETAAGHLFGNSPHAAPAGEIPASGRPPPPPSFDGSYFRSLSVPYPTGHEVQVSQVSQSWRPDLNPVPRSFGGAGYRTSGGTLDLGVDDPAVRHRRNPHQMNWWAQMYGYQRHGRPNYALPLASVHPPCTAASYCPSQVSPSCNQVLSHVDI